MNYEISKDVWWLLKLLIIVLGCVALVLLVGGLGVVAMAALLFGFGFALKRWGLLAWICAIGVLGLGAVGMGYLNRFLLHEYDYDSEFLGSLQVVLWFAFIIFVVITIYLMLGLRLTP